MILNRNQLLPLTVLGNIWDVLPIKLGSDPGAHELCGTEKDLPCQW